MLWSQGNPPPASSLVFVSKEQEESAALSIATDEWPDVQNVAVVFPSGLQMLPLISAVVLTDKCEQVCAALPFEVGPLISALSPLDGAARELTEIACELIIGLRRNDGAAVTYACALLISAEERLNLLPSTSVSLLRKLAKFIDEFGRGPFREWTLPALFIHPDNKDKRKYWWKDEPSIARSFRRSADRFSALVNGNVPSSVKQIKTWLITLQVEADKLHLAPGTTRSEADVFRAASAFMAVNARIHENEGRYVFALLYLHRACEWLLAALCADLNLLDFTSRSGPRIRSRLENMGFNDLLNEAVTAGSSRIGALVTNLRTLNTWRNLLTCTHHMSAPSEADAAALIASIRALLPNLGGPCWRTTFAALSAPFPLSVVDLLDPFGDVRSTFVLKTAGEMRLLMD